MSEMVERMRMAIWERAGVRLSDESMEHMIEAMREPTEAMMIAAGANSCRQAKAIWIRMIDEALK